jgi:hypothetical protein
MTTVKTASTEVSTGLPRPPPDGLDQAERETAAKLRPAVSDGQDDDLPFGRRLRRRRMALGTLERLACEMQVVAVRYGLEPAKTTSLVPMIGRWEHGGRIGQQSLHLLAEALGVSVAELGMPIDPDYPWPPPR